MEATILIVDDEASLVELLKQALALQWPDVEVYTACSGEEGLSQLASRAYDLVITDYLMPGFSGLELLQGIRYLDPAISVILMTAHGSEQIRLEAQKLGVDRYLSKPFQLEELMLAAGSVLTARK